MFSKAHRINSWIFMNILKNGKKYFSQYFRCVKNGAAITKVAVVIPKKIIKTRVKRNREKRRILHGVKKVLIDRGYTGDYIFWIQKDTQALGTEKLENEIKGIINQAHK